MIKLPLVYNQMNPQWANRLLGYNTNPLFNFYNYACLISTLGTIAKYYGKNEDPVSIDEKLKQIEGYVAGTGIYIHGKFTQLFPDIVEERVKTPGPLTDEHLIHISEAIRDGNPVMFHIDTNVSTVRPDSHFVLAIGMNPNDIEDVTIADPIGGRTHSLKDYAGGVRRLVEEYFIYRGPVPANPVNDPMVSEKASVRDMLVTKATNFDDVAEFVRMSEEERVKVGAGKQIVEYVKKLQTSIRDLSTDLEEIKRYTPMPEKPSEQFVPSEQDKNILFQDISEVLGRFFGRFKK